MKTLQELYNFSGKVIIITGGAGAIGSATAEFLSSLGATVVISDLNGEKAKELAEKISTQTGNPATGIKTDATDETEIQDLVETVVKKYGKISGLVNNVGWGPNTPIWESDTQKMIDSYKLNTLSGYLLTKFAMPYLQKEENASVVFSGSMVGNTPSPEFIEYSNAKAALLNMVRSMAVISGPEVRFNTIIIGSVDNGESSKEAGLTDEMLQNISNSMVMKRRGNPADIAYAIAFLLSEASSWITATDLTVNGGGSYKSKMPKS